MITLPSLHISVLELHSKTEHQNVASKGLTQCSSLKLYEMEIAESGMGDSHICGVTEFCVC